MEKCFNSLLTDDQIEPADSEQPPLSGLDQLKTMLNSLPGMAYRCKNDHSWTMEFVSSGCFELTGYQPWDFLYNKRLTYERIIDPEDRCKVWDSIQEKLLAHQRFKITYQIHTKGGQIKWLLEQGHGIYTNDGHVEAVEGFITDITDHKQADMHLKKSEGKYRTLVESSTDIIIIVDQNGTFVFANRTAAQMFGKTQDQMIGLKLNDLLSDTDANDCMRDITLVIQSNRCLLREKIKTINGAKKWLRISIVPVPMNPDGPIEAMCIASDISAQKIATEQFRESEEKFRTIVETSEDVIFQLNRSGRILYVSPKVTDIYGWSTDQLIGAHIRITTPVTELFRVFKVIRTILAGNTLKNFEITQRDKLGRLVPMEVNAAPIRKNGKIVGIQGIMRNVAERKQTELELRRANESLKENDRLKNDFVSTVSHELRTPLCIFKNVLSNVLAQLYGPVAPKLRQNLEMADKSIDRLARIINDFLDVSKIEAGKMGLDICDVDVQKLIREAIETFKPLAQSKNLHLRATMQDGPVIIRADRDKLIQIVTNLLSNAVKFTPVDGRITVLLGNYDQQITLAVSDTGIGLGKEDLEKLFDRYFQVKKQVTAPVPGTGLGLTIVKELVEMHHGKIWAQSQLGSGTTFTVVLPKA